MWKTSVGSNSSADRFIRENADPENQGEGDRPFGMGCLGMDQSYSRSTTFFTTNAYRIIIFTEPSFLKGGFFTEKEPQGNTSAPAQLQRVQTQTGIINTIYRKNNKIDWKNKSYIYG